MVVHESKSRVTQEVSWERTSQVGGAGVSWSVKRDDRVSGECIGLRPPPPPPTTETHPLLSKQHPLVFLAGDDHH